MLVQYLRTRYGDDTANWCERFWTGDRSRYCLVHSRYGGCNNNIGVEVTWRDIKNHVIPWEHWALSSERCVGGSRQPWERRTCSASRAAPECQPPSPARRGRSRDQLQGVHRFTLSCCIILESPRQHAQNAYIDLMAEVMECGPDPAPHQSKIATYHHKRVEAGHAMPL